MTYTNSFRTNIDEQSQGYLKFMVSRTFSNPRDNILEMQVPAMLPDEFTVELSLYSLSDDSLVYNVVYASSNQNSFHIRTLQYENEEVRKLLFIDFSAIQENLPVGDFRLVLNFLADDVGTAGQPLLEVTTVSATRQEIQLDLLPQYDTEEYQNVLMEFAQPRVTSQWIYTVIDQIFGKVTTQLMPSDNSVLKKESIRALFPEGLNNIALQELDTATQTILNSAHTSSVSKINLDILANKPTFSNVYISDVVSTNITSAYNIYVTQSMQSQQSAKFILAPINGNSE